MLVRVRKENKAKPAIARRPTETGETNRERRDITTQAELKPRVIRTASCGSTSRPKKRLARYMFCAKSSNSVRTVITAAARKENRGIK